MKSPFKPFIKAIMGPTKNKKIIKNLLTALPSNQNLILFTATKIRINNGCSLVIYTFKHF